MHLALQVYDVLECICNHLLADRALSTLATLACTCTTFADPALNALWYNIPSLEPLIRCLPEDAWAIRSTRYHPVLTLVRNTTPADWDRCKFYTRRIRQFGRVEPDVAAIPGELKGSIPADRTIFMALKPSSSSRESRSVPTIPKLLSCRLVPRGSAPIPHFAPFLTPSLRSLEVTSPTYDPEAILPGMLRSVAFASPLLQSLRIDGVSIVPPFESAFSINGDGDEAARQGPKPVLVRMIQGLTRLESLVCPCIRFPDDAIRHLASQLKIRELHIKNTATEILEASRPILRKAPYFAHLQRLSVECGHSLEECANLLGHVNVSRISYLEVGRNNGVPTEQELWNFIHTLCGLLSQTKETLRTLYVHQNLWTGFVSPSHRPRPASIYTITLNTLAPLLVFPNLTALNIVFDTRFAFDNADAECMARSWQHLSVLQFGFPGAGWYDEGIEKVRQGKQKVMTLDGLGSFAKWCPGLKILGVCMNGVTNEKHSRKESRVQCSSLHFLDVGDSVYDDPECVASYLVDIFPELQGVYGPDVAVSPEWQKKWMKVSQMIKGLSLEKQMEHI